MTWTPKILTDFEIGQAAAAIEAVGRLGKPLAEVGSRVGSREDIEHDLKACLAQRREAGRVSVWIRPDGERFRFGFYGEAWTQRAMDFLDQTDLEPSDRHWICGLLFGYQAAAIQEFIDATSESVLARTASQSSSRRPNSNRTSHLRGIPAGSRS